MIGDLVIFVWVWWLEVFYACAVFALGWWARGRYSEPRPRQRAEGTP